MNSPFKFLDPFTKKDRDVFFGREEEIETLYELALMGRVLVVYGLSGTGKTSLVQCGLANRFESTEWFPMLIRRGHDFNRSLAEALGARVDQKAASGTVADQIAHLYKEYLRPVYLIFDQFEELFVLGDEQEQKQFLHTLKELMEADLSCRIMLVMREEYIGRLYSFEKVIPTLFHYRLRVEPMNLGKVERVISRSCEKFNITLEDPEKNVQQIIDHVSGGKSGIHLPYLQVYLDMLWRQVYRKTYGIIPEETDAKPADLALTFTGEDISETGPIEEVLDRFLHQQKEDLQKRLAKKYPALPKEAVQQVLDLFVTEEGTKRPISISREERGGIALAGVGKTPIAHLPQAALHEILMSLDKARILRVQEKQIELAHDSLARLIDHDRSAEQRQRNLARRRIKAAYLEHQVAEAFLTRKQLNSLEDVLPGLQLEPELEQFIEDSLADAQRKEEEKLEQVRREQKVRRQRILLGVIGVALVTAAGLGFWAYREWRLADKLADIMFQSEDEEVTWFYGYDFERFVMINRKGDTLGRFVWDNPRKVNENVGIAYKESRYWWVREGDTISVGYDFIHPTDKEVYFGYIGSRPSELLALDPQDGSEKRGVDLEIQRFGLFADQPEPNQTNIYYEAIDVAGRAEVYEVNKPLYGGIEVAKKKAEGEWVFLDQQGLEFGPDASEEVLKKALSGKLDAEPRNSETFTDEVLWPPFIPFGKNDENKLRDPFTIDTLGYKDSMGRVVIQPKYQSAEGFANGIAKVIQNFQTGYIDPKGNPVIAIEYDQIYKVGPNQFRTNKGGWEGYTILSAYTMDKEPRKIIHELPCEYEQVGRFEAGYLPVKREGKWRFAFWENDELEPQFLFPKYDVVTPYFEIENRQLVALAYDDGLGKIFFLNEKGEMRVNLYKTDQ